MDKRILYFRRGRHLVSGACLLLALGCRFPEPTNPDHCGSGGADTCGDDDSVDPSDHTGEAGCGEAQRHLAEMGCAMAQDPNFAAACQNIEDRNADGTSELDVDTDCLFEAKTCTDAERC